MRTTAGKVQSGFGHGRFLAVKVSNAVDMPPHSVVPSEFSSVFTRQIVHVQVLKIKTLSTKATCIHVQCADSFPHLYGLLDRSPPDVRKLNGRCLNRHACISAGTLRGGREERAGEPTGLRCDKPSSLSLHVLPEGSGKSGIRHD